MQLETLAWDPVDGWSSDVPDLDSPSTLVLVFGDTVVDADRRAIDDVAAAYPTSVIMGCSTSGLILDRSLRDGACVVAVARFDAVRLRRITADVRCSSDSSAAGAAIGRGLDESDLRAVFLLSDGLHVNGSDLVSGLAQSVPPGVIITGGLAGDGDRFGSTWVLDGDVRSANRVLAVGLYGEALRIGTGSMGGWGIFGPERTVTCSSGNVLAELDGKPALELYTRYLGDLADQLPASALLFPLAIREPGGDHQVVRTVLAVDQIEHTMTFAGDIPRGWTAQLMRSSTDRLVDGASVAAAMSAEGAGDGTPTLAIAVSCVGRRLVLGERTEEEIEAAVDALAAGCRLVGFYSYGEIAPGPSGTAELHNQTMTVTTLGEATVR